MAHSPTEEHPEGQALKEHLEGAARHASFCLKDVGLEKTAYLAGLLHDLGKFTAEFQTYLKSGDRSKRGSVIHTFQACRYFLELIPPAENADSLAIQYTAELLAFATGAHHGLFDCVNDAGLSGMQYRKGKENISYNEAVAGLYSQGITREKIASYFASATEEIDRVLLRLEETYERDDEYFFEVGLLGRLLLSAVIEGDRNDTISFVKQIPALPLYGDMRPIWRGKLEVLEKKLETFPSDSAVAEARKEISNQCKRFAKEPKGIYRLNVPTGGGKTLSSLRYALAHAEQYNQKKLIFTSPLLSILEQNAAVIRNYVGDDDLILEHHSNVVLTEPSREQLDERELMVQNWDAPIIITTLVQLLNCLFDGKTTSIRRFQALCNSVIVIDEVQTVPTKLLSLFNLAIRFLAEQCGSTVILCSATQPYLEGVEHPLLPAPKSIVPFDPAIWNAFVRTQMLPLKNRRLEELPELILTLMQDTESLLVVCNKKSEAAYLLEQTRSSAFVSYHLSASMCMQHRRDAVAALKKSLNLKEKVLCISTQVIEAGVDISFQCVLRLTAGMDSIVQSAGRCNRNRESEAPCPVYLVNCTDEQLGRLQDIRRGKTATLSLLHAFHTSPERFHDDLASDEAITYYYSAFYADMNDKAQDYPLPELKTTILDLASENNRFSANGGIELENFCLRQAFKTAGQAFSVFDEDTVDVLVPYGKGAQLIAQMCDSRCARDTEYCASLLKEATGFTVSLYRYQFRQLEAQGALIWVCNDCALALLPEYYDDQVGLKTDHKNNSFWEV